MHVFGLKNIEIMHITQNKCNEKVIKTGETSMKESNPYSIMFDQVPREIISRDDQKNEIINAFLSGQHIYMISGVHGLGKTVFMTTVASKYQSKDWIVININTTSAASVLEQIAIQLSQYDDLTKKIEIPMISLNVLGLKVNDNKPFYNAEQAVLLMLEEEKKHNKKILITVDEVTNTESIREFAGAFQIWIREYLPVYLLMTGLYENIRDLQNENNLTFLYRTPRIELSPLSLLEIQRNYEKNLNVSDTQAQEMARATKGYSFAFQALGHEVYSENGLTEKAKKRYQEDLFEYSYRKIWEDLSNNDKKVCEAIASTSSTAVVDIRSNIDFESNKFNQYRKRLIEKGIIYSKEKGHIMFCLPLFKEFVNFALDEDFY